MPVWTCHWRRRRFASLMARARSSGRRKWLPSLRLWWAIFRAQLDPITYLHLASPSREAQMNRFVWRCLRKALPRGRGFNDAYTRVHGRPRAETDSAAPFPAQPAFRAPDGPHAGAPRPHPPPARRRAQHRGAPRPRHSKAPQSGTRPQPTVARLRSLQRDCVRLANDGQDTRALQQYLGHKNIQRTVRYTELAADRFKSFWENEA
jgi:Phage integrase family